MGIDSKYNYHSHTFRCGHAADIPDSCYIDEAIKRGYLKYGITDHIPVHPIFFGDWTVRMHDSDKCEYLDSINHLKELYKGTIEIYSGFEAEYDEIIEEYLCSLRDDCDYMIMGQHYVLNKNIRNSPEYPLEYAKKVCAGIESGIFDIVAHPDIFMQYRFGMTDIVDSTLFMKNAIIAAKMICSKAKEYNVPLELNLGGTYLLSQKYVNSIGEKDPEVVALENARNAKYPMQLFWEVASEMGNDVVVGIDAHFIEEIGLRDAKLEKIGTYIDLSKLNFLPDSYDPVSARKDNLKLQEAYQKTKDNLSSVEGRLVASYIDDVLLSDVKTLNKYRLKTALIRKLREEPSRRKFNLKNDTDIYTYQKREELVKVIKDSSRKAFGRASSRDEYVSSLIDDIDYHYDVQKAVIDIDKDGNVIGLDKGGNYGK